MHDHSKLTPCSTTIQIKKYVHVLFGTVTYEWLKDYILDADTDVCAYHLLKVVHLSVCIASSKHNLCMKEMTQSLDQQIPI